MPCNKLVDTKHKDFWLRIKFRCGEIIGNKERLCQECKSNLNSKPVQKTSRGCGNELDIPYDSDKSYNGCGSFKCGEGILCSDCSPNLNKESQE